MGNSFDFQTHKVATLSSILKILLAIMALYTFEPISNNFKQKAHRLPYSKNEFLFFSNISMIYTVLGVVTGFLRSTSGLGWLHDFVVPTATILEIVVVTIFWSLFVLKRELVIRTNAEPGGWAVLRECPKHMFPLAILVMEQCERAFSKSHSQRMFLFLFSVLYYRVNEMLIMDEKNYPYPFLEHLSYRMRALLFLVVMAISLGLYEIIYL